MKTLVVSLLFIGIAIATAFFIHKDPGQVDVTFLGLDYSLSLGLALAGIGIVFLLLYILLRAFFGLVNAPQALRVRSERKHFEKSHEAMGRGLVEYSEGLYEKAESTLTRYTTPNNFCEAATLITAARVANDLNQLDNCNAYLSKAIECSPESALAVSITEAELLLQRKEYQAATKKLSAIHNSNPKNKHVIYLLIKAYESSQNWESMSDILKEGRKKHVRSKSELLSLEHIAAIGIMKKAPAENAQSLFSNFPLHVQKLSDVVYAYVEKLCEIGKDNEASSLVTKSLNSNWNENLAELYGSIASSDLSSQIQQALTWKDKNGDSAALFLSLGNLLYQNDQIAEAKDYVVSSIEIKPSVSAFFLLGKILEAVDDPVAALEAYKHGYAFNKNNNIVFTRKSDERAVNDEKIAEPV